MRLVGVIIVTWGVVCIGAIAAVGLLGAISLGGRLLADRIGRWISVGWYRYQWWRALRRLRRGS